MGVAFWDPAVEIPAEEVDRRLRAGRPTALNGKRFASAFDLCSRPTPSAGGTAWA